ncbi:putative transmembrane protein [Raphanus sativus]|nr:putative transmembrane protein [Raphanus sativus]KAJ4865918.1 putative transmembrane protein [Raphanus sativus]
MVSMLLLQGSESLLLLPPPPEPPPFVFLLDLLTGVSAPDPPDPPDASETLALDMSSFPCHCFTLAAARSPLHSTTTSDSACLLIVSLGVNLVKPLLLPTNGYSITWKGMTFVTSLDVSIWDGTYLRFGFLVLRIRNHSRPLPQYEDLMLLVSHCFTHYEDVRHLFCLHLPQYEAHLPQYEVHLPQYEAHLPQHEVYNSKRLEMELKKPTLASYFQTCLSGRGGSCNSTPHYGCSMFGYQFTACVLQFPWLHLTQH